MVKWEALARPKEFGGLCFMDVRVMNSWLVGKWIDRLEIGENNLCVELLMRKYIRNKSIYQIKVYWVTILERCP
jgi:hypothetical protein